MLFTKRFESGFIRLTQIDPLPPVNPLKPLEKFHLILKDMPVFARIKQPHVSIVFSTRNIGRPLRGCQTVKFKNQVIHIPRLITKSTCDNIRQRRQRSFPGAHMHLARRFQQRAVIHSGDPFEYII